jgi:hypothetical protein
MWNVIINENLYELGARIAHDDVLDLGPWERIWSDHESLGEALCERAKAAAFARDRAKPEQEFCDL